MDMLKVVNSRSSLTDSLQKRPELVVARVFTLMTRPSSRHSPGTPITSKIIMPRRCNRMCNRMCKTREGVGWCAHTPVQTQREHAHHVLTPST
eukprot:357753-Chlamydomonas_euryale.AAC.2